MFKSFLKILPSILCLLLNFSVYGQGEFGIKFGTNLSRVEGEFDYYKTKNQIGFQAALVYSYPLSEVVAIRPEIAFVQKGGKVDYTLKSYDAQWKLNGIQRINYLEIPINFDFKVISSKENSFIISLGIYGAAAIGGQLDLKNDFTDLDQPYNSELIHYKMPMEFKDVVTYEDQSSLGSFEEEYGFVRKYDFGPKFGFAYRLKSISIDLSYSIGFSNINPHEEGVISNEIQKSNRSLQFSIAYFFKNQ
jgi:hypothetical protein